MSPLPYPHRVAFLAAALNVPETAHGLAVAYARVLGAVTFDHLVRHPILSVADYDDERFELDDRMLDARHPETEDTIDALFRVARRHEVLWFDVGVDGRAPARLRSRLPQGPIEEWVATGGELSQQLAECIDRWLEARRLPRVGAMTPFTLADLHAVASQLERAAIASRAGAIPPSLITPP